MCSCEQGTCPGGCPCGCSHTPPERARECQRCAALGHFAEALWTLPKRFADTVTVHPYDMADAIDDYLRRPVVVEEPLTDWERDLLDGPRRHPAPTPEGPQTREGEDRG